jgi:hypothetical protein
MKRAQYRRELEKLALSQEQEPTEDYVFVSDVIKLLDTIESDFNSLKSRIISDLDDIKHETERRLEIMSDDLY